MARLDAVKKCPHGRRKSYCRDCGGGAFCSHGKVKTHCSSCSGSQTCPHGIRHQTCKTCGGASVCDHGVFKSRCSICGGSDLCECGAIKNPRYEGWCADCFHRTFPDDPRSVNKNDGEYRLGIHLDRHHLVMSWSKERIDCEGRRLTPDAIVQLKSGKIVVVELDG